MHPVGGAGVHFIPRHSKIIRKIFFTVLFLSSRRAAKRTRKQNVSQMCFVCSMRTKRDNNERALAIKVSNGSMTISIAAKKEISASVRAYARSWRRRPHGCSAHAQDQSKRHANHCVRDPNVARAEWGTRIVGTPPVHLPSCAETIGRAHAGARSRSHAAPRCRAHGRERACAQHSSAHRRARGVGSGCRRSVSYTPHSPASLIVFVDPGRVPRSATPVRGHPYTWVGSTADAWAGAIDTRDGTTKNWKERGVPGERTHMTHGWLGRP